MARPRVEFLVVATVRKPHGVRGELKLAVETDRPDLVFQRGRVLLVGDAAGRPSGTSLTVERTRTIPDGVLLKAAEIVGLTPGVEALRGRTLLIPRSEAAPAAEDEVLYHDLLGLTVLVAGEPIGKVASVLDAGGGELLAVQRPQGKELLVPFVRELVRRVDLERRELEIDPPEGLLDL